MIVHEIRFDLPLRTVSLANEHAHWRARQSRAKAERKATKYVWISKNERWLQPGETAWVHLTRVGPRALDSDNLPPSLKSVRDQLAEGLGLDDRDPRITWVYSQEKGPYSVRVHIERRSQP